MPGASVATTARPATRRDHDRDVGRHELRERARSGEAESLQRDQPRSVDAEDAAKQVLGRHLQDQRVLTEHPRAAEAGSDQQRNRDREARLAGERQ